MTRMKMNHYVYMFQFNCSLLLRELTKNMDLHNVVPLM